MAHCPQPTCAVDGHPAVAGPAPRGLSGRISGPQAAPCRLRAPVSARPRTLRPALGVARRPRVGASARVLRARPPPPGLSYRTAHQPRRRRAPGNARSVLVRRCKPWSLTAPPYRVSHAPTAVPSPNSGTTSRFGPRTGGACPRTAAWSGSETPAARRPLPPRAAPPAARCPSAGPFPANRTAGWPMAAQRGTVLAARRRSEATASPPLLPAPAVAPASASTASRKCCTSLRMVTQRRPPLRRGRRQSQTPASSTMHPCRRQKAEQRQRQTHALPQCPHRTAHPRGPSRSAPRGQAPALPSAARHPRHNRRRHAQPPPLLAALPGSGAAARPSTGPLSRWMRGGGGTAQPCAPPPPHTASLPRRRHTARAGATDSAGRALHASCRVPIGVTHSSSLRAYLLHFFPFLPGAQTVLV